MSSSPHTRLSRRNAGRPGSRPGPVARRPARSAAGGPRLPADSAIAGSGKGDARPAQGGHSSQHADDFPQAGAVHHSWHWAFRRVTKAQGGISLLAVGDSSIDRIYIKHGVTELDCLNYEAPDTPRWEEALEMSDEEAAALGNLGAHISVFLLDSGKVMLIRKASDTAMLTERSRRQPHEGKSRDAEEEFAK